MPIQIIDTHYGRHYLTEGKAISDQKILAVGLEATADDKDTELNGFQCKIFNVCWIGFREFLQNNGSGVFMMAVRHARVQDSNGKIYTTYANAWSVWDDLKQRHYICRIGLGAYGDWTAWQRELIPHDSQLNRPLPGRDVEEPVYCD